MLGVTDGLTLPLGVGVTLPDGVGVGEATGHHPSCGSGGLHAKRGKSRHAGRGLHVGVGFGVGVGEGAWHHPPCGSGGLHAGVASKHAGRGEHATAPSTMSS